MPVKVKKNETQRDFISRCIGIEREAGKEIDQATAICYSYWENRNMSSQEKVVSRLKRTPAPKI